MDSKAMQILKLKQATIECNPLYKNNRKCAAIYKNEVDELIERLEYLEKVNEIYGRRKYRENV